MDNAIRGNADMQRKAYNTLLDGPINYDLYVDLTVPAKYRKYVSVKKTLIAD